MKFTAALIFSAITLSAADLSLPAAGLVAHEWGTFTSVAGKDGAPVAWALLNGPAELPCFVERLGTENLLKRLSGLVRMETPVLYFYVPSPVTLSVRVDFPKGWITEWYPQATQNRKVSAHSLVSGIDYGSIGWDSVQVLPGENLKFPGSKGASNYYAARDTDAAPLRIGNQQEKLIFYRGIGSFQAPLWPKYLSDGKIEMRNIADQAIPLAIVFENRGAQLGYQVVRGIHSGEVISVDPPEMKGNLAQLRKQLAGELVEFGLYQKEALAMIETWHDSWFEEGTRIFYIYPRAEVDAVLPLKINPAPVTIERVFVGRVEVLSPWTRQTIRNASEVQDLATLKKFGRFLEPFAAQMPQTNFTQQAQNEIRRTASHAVCVQ